jgi:hypothetical protein
VRRYRGLPFLMLLAGLAPSWAQTSADLRGIYIFTNDVTLIPTSTEQALSASLNVAGTDGLALVVGWNGIEPAMGQYQWTKLDQWMSLAVSLGKKINLIVMAGNSTPSWMYQAAPAGAGVTPLNFTISPKGGVTGVCQSATMAAPWDATFLSQWDAMLANLSAHLKSTGTYSAVTLLRLTGINRTSEELRLPAETAQ